MTKWIEKIQKSLSPDLLKKEYQKGNQNNPFYGHCYVATEVLYHLMNSKEVKPCCGKDEQGVVHWWLQYKNSGKRIDVTSEQYSSVDKTPPYDVGRGCGFLTKQPSKRAQIVINKVMTMFDHSLLQKV